MATDDLYDEIADSHYLLRRGSVWCLKCGHHERVSAATCLRSGWPMCHGATMSIQSPKELARRRRAQVSA